MSPVTEPKEPGQLLESPARPSLRDRFLFQKDPAAELAEQSPFTSALFEVEERASEVERTLKLWRKTARQIDSDLRALWLHEVRQVERMMAYDGARRVIVGLVELVEDDEFFGMVLERAGHTLDVLLEKASREHWLRNLAAHRPRRLFWENALRLVDALRILHAQGLVHGRLDTRAVISEGAEQPDFLLSSFEWSFRFSPEAEKSRATLGRGAASRRPRSYSFASDWAALGDLLADLLGFHVSRSGELSLPPNAPPMPLTLAERNLFKRLIAPSKFESVGADYIRAAILDILSYVPHGGEIQTGSFILVFAQQAGLDRAVYDATEGAIDVEDRQAQFAWVRADFGARVTLLSPRSFDPTQNALRILTTTSIYELEAYRDAGSPVWDIAVCKRVRRREPRLDHPGDIEHTIEAPIEIASGFRKAVEMRAQRGASVLDWSAFARRQSVLQPESTTRIRRALVLIQLVEAVLKALEVYPVEIARTQRRTGTSVVTLRALATSDRDTFANRIGLMDTRRTFSRIFEEENPEADAEWILSKDNGLSARPEDAIGASYIGAVSDGGITSYEFETDYEPPPSARYFLRPTSGPGTEQVIRRRLRALASLDARADLADMFDDPWRGRRTLHEPIVDDKFYRDLDHTKQDALRQLWSTLPVFFVVGPPGVGKTMLATEVLRRKFALERSARVLLSAQGHDALEHLQVEVKKTLAKAGFTDLLVVRSAPDDRPNQDGADVAAAQHLARFSESELSHQLPAALRARIDGLAASESSNEDLSGMRAMGNLVRDAANIVIATANSGDIERLVEAREQFDLVVVEEAAKATGPEIVGPLMLSGRRLLIGDHHQLPPFDADRLLKVLSDDSLVKDTIAMAEDVAASLFGDDLAALANLTPQERRDVATVAVRLVEPFRTFVEEDERRRSRRDNAKPMSSTLTEQRRMDPAIAELVSRAFYEGSLKTEAGRAAAAENVPAPFVWSKPLTSAPIVVVDFPHVSSTGTAESPERAKPRWHNPSEVNAVIDVLSLVRPMPGAPHQPSLAVLSPYNAQVKRIAARIEKERARKLSHLSLFTTAREGLDLVGTVDSFQGSEADLVVVSLVRNNPRTGKRALGFLRDSRRMNVLLSRAKQQLILVGSLAFLREAVKGLYSDGPGDLGFLEKLLAALDDLRRRKRVDGSPLVQIVKPTSLRSAK